MKNFIKLLYLISCISNDRQLLLLKPELNVFKRKRPGVEALGITL